MEVIREIFEEWACLRHGKRAIVNGTVDVLIAADAELDFGDEAWQAEPVLRTATFGDGEHLGGRLGAGTDLAVEPIIVQPEIVLLPLAIGLLFVSLRVVEQCFQTGLLIHALNVGYYNKPNIFANLHNLLFILIFPPIHASGQPQILLPASLSLSNNL